MYFFYKFTHHLIKINRYINYRFHTDNLKPKVMARVTYRSPFVKTTECVSYLQRLLFWLLLTLYVMYSYKLALLTH